MFSPLTTTKSSSRRSRSDGSRPSSVRLPRPPTTSPTNRMLVAIGRDCRARGAKAYMSAGEVPEPGAMEHGIAAATEPPAARTVERVVIRRWVQLVLLPLALLGLWELAKAAGTLFLVLVIACLVALILAPTVRILDRVMPRGLAILSVYLGLVAVVVGI